MRSAEECGLDSRNLRSLQDITRPALFPDIKLHSSGDNRLLRVLDQQKAEEASKANNSLGAAQTSSVKDDQPPKLAGVKRSAQTLFLISKGREIHHRIQSSVFYVRPTKDVPDVIRYSDSTKPPPQIDASAVLSNCLGGRKKTKLGRYVPEELVSGQIQVLGSTWGQFNDAGISTGYNLVELEAKERRRRRLGSVDTAGEGDEDAEEEGVVEDEEEEDGEDYVKDYYESEGDESAGDDAEATF
jgi:hypothetical protein